MHTDVKIVPRGQANPLATQTRVQIIKKGDGTVRQPPPPQDPNSRPRVARGAPGLASPSRVHTPRSALDALPKPAGVAQPRPTVVSEPAAAPTDPVAQLQAAIARQEEKRAEVERSIASLQNALADLQSRAAGRTRDAEPAAAELANQTEPAAAELANQTELVDTEASADFSIPANVEIIDVPTTVQIVVDAPPPTTDGSDAP